MSSTYFGCDNLDDALIAIYKLLLHDTEEIPASRGAFTELIGALIELRSPRARLSRTESRGKPFSCLGELLWYLSQDNSLEFIAPYIPAYEDESDDGATVHGAYGPRLFRMRGVNQIKNITNLLRRKPTSRRAVVQLFNAEDLVGNYKEIPCTTTMQFLVRNGLVHMLVTMRSNDAYKGLPHDVFCFTMLQEIVARSLGLEIGTYRHFAGSLHLYNDDRAQAQKFLEEKYQRRIEMPSMPQGDPWRDIWAVIDAERRIRGDEVFDANDLGIDSYWADLVRLLQIFAASGDGDRIRGLKAAMSHKKYNPYIATRMTLKAKPRFRPIQFTLDLHGN